MRTNPAISIIIPTLNEEENIILLLEDLVKVKNTEIIVVDGGSKDRTLEFVRKYTEITCISEKKGRAIQMNAGARLAVGETLLFLHADTFLPEGFSNEITGCMKDPEVVGGSFFLKFDRKHPLLDIYSWFSKFNLSVFTYGDQAIFIRTDLFRKIGGYATIPLMEDLEIQKKLRNAGKFIKLNSGVITSARKFREKGFLWNEMRNILIVGLYFAGVSPKALAKYY